MFASILGWLILIVASAVPGIAGFLFQWDRITLSRSYFFLAIGICFLWWGYSWLKPQTKADL